MQRNLLRCLTWMLPSGQSIANEMGIPPLSNAELAELQRSVPRLSHRRRFSITS